MNINRQYNPQIETIIQNEMLLSNEFFDIEDTPRARDTFYCIGCHNYFDIKFRAHKERMPRCLSCDKIRKKRQK